MLNNHRASLNRSDYLTSLQFTDEQLQRATIHRQLASVVCLLRTVNTAVFRLQLCQTLQRFQTVLSVVVSFVLFFTRFERYHVTYGR